MQQQYNYKKFAVLYVDDEEKSLKYFTRALEDDFRILTAPNAEEGFKLFEAHKDDIAILVTDQRMPGEKGVQLLERVRNLRPRVIRMLATAYSDIEAAISAVNTGAIYKYIHKPFDVPQLDVTLRRAMEFFLVQLERDHLLHEKLSVLQNMIITDRVISLGIVGSGLQQRLRNPLGAVRAFLDMDPLRLREATIDLEAFRNPNYWRDYHAHVQQQARELMKLLPGNGSPESVTLAKIVDTAIAQVRPELDARKARVENGVPPSISLSLNSGSVQRMFELLLKALASHLPEGGVVTLNAQIAPDGGVSIEIRNQGTGIPANTLRTLFNPFSKPDAGAAQTGLNLLGFYLLAYHNGGLIQASDSGTRFQLTLPASAPAATETEEEFVSKVLANESVWERLLSVD